MVDRIGSGGGVPNYGSSDPQADALQDLKNILADLKSGQDPTADYEKLAAIPAQDLTYNQMNWIRYVVRDDSGKDPSAIQGAIKNWYTNNPPPSSS